MKCSLNEIIKSCSIELTPLAVITSIFISELNAGACKILAACIMHNYPNLVCHLEFTLQSSHLSNICTWAPIPKSQLISAKLAKDKAKLSGVNF